MSSITTNMPDKRANIDFLRNEIMRMEGFKTGKSSKAISFGIPEIDASFPVSGIPMGATHEFCVFDQESIAATVGFLAALISKSTNDGAIVWIERSQTLHPPGLSAFGLDANRIIFVEARREQDALAIIEEALRTEGLTAVVGQIEKADLDQTRRLQLAVEQSGNIGLFMRVMKQPSEFSSACVSRWCINHAPSQDIDNLPGLGQQRWSASLDKVRHGKSKEWLLDWQEGNFHLVRPHVEIEEIKPVSEPSVIHMWR